MKEECHGFEAGTSPPGGMSRDDFEKWFADHYQRILAVTGKRWGFENVEDDVAKAYVRTLNTKNYEKCETNPLSWFLQAVKSVASNRRRAEGRDSDAQRDLKIISQGRKSKPTGAKRVNYSDDDADDRESFAPPTRPRPAGGQRRDWD